MIPLIKEFRQLFFFFLACIVFLSCSKNHDHECGPTTADRQFITFTVNGGPVVNFLSPADTLEYQVATPNPYIAIIGGPTSWTKYVSFAFSNTNIQAGSVQNLVTFYGSQVAEGTNTNIVTPVSVNITEYGAVGQYIAGNLTGTIYGNIPTSTPYNISCSFRIKRTF